MKSTILPWVRRSGGIFDDASVKEQAGEVSPILPPPIRRGSSLSSVSSASSMEIHMQRAPPPLHMSRHEQHQLGGRRGRTAADLQKEIFPEGVPSQGVLKAGAQHIQADVRLQFAGNQCCWHGFVMDDVLYTQVPDFVGDDQQFRNAAMAFMELAEDILGCSSVLVALPKVAGATTVRAFMYSGFELVSPLLYQPDPAYILVGYDSM